MQQNRLTTVQEIAANFGDHHARIYSLIAQDNQIMTTYGLECATDLDSEVVAKCLGDLVRGSYIRVYEKAGRRPAWETVRNIAIAS